MPPSDPVMARCKRGCEGLRRSGGGLAIAARTLLTQGMRLNHERLFRIHREERLGVRKRGVRKRGGRKRALGTRADGVAERAEPALVTGVRVGRVGQRASVPGAGDRGR